MAIHASSLIQNCHIADDVVIGPYCFLSDVTIARGVSIEGNVRIEKSTLEANTQVLWGAIIRDSYIGPDCVIGAEVKKSHLTASVRAKHLGTVIWSARVGTWVNFWWGAVCANYDGRGKWDFVIWDSVFIGSHAILSVRAGETRTIESGAKIGANVHIDRDVTQDTLVYIHRETGVVTFREGYQSTL